jgi:hypothetical protein
MQTVGVAPGTTTLTFAGLGRSGHKCPPEEKRWLMPDRAADPTIHQHAYPDGFKPYTKDLNGPRTVYFDPYQRDIWRLRGLGDPRFERQMRWDLVALMGGGAFLVAMITGILAAR